MTLEIFPKAGYDILYTGENQPMRKRNPEQKFWMAAEEAVLNNVHKNKKIEILMPNSEQYLENFYKAA